jgi:hypothetical protein
MTTTPYPRTSLGVKVMNFTHYNTDDIVAALNWMEGTLPADTTIWKTYAEGVSFREMGHSKDTNRVKVRSGHGVRRGVIFIVPPKEIYDNPLEALASEGQESPTIPHTVMVRLLDTLTSMYESHPKDDEDEDGGFVEMTPENVPAMAIRIEKSRQNKVPRDGKYTARRNAHRELVSLSYKLGTMKRTLMAPPWREVKRARSKGQAPKARNWREINHITGTDKTEKAVKRLAERLMELRSQIAKEAAAIRMPEFTQEEK